MANAPLTLDVIAKEALMILDNNLIAAKMVHRGFEDEFGNAMNGFEAGDTISIRRPTDFTVRDGPVALNQDVVEAKVSLVVDKQKGVDFGFTSKELTLNINELSERVIKPAMVQLANQIDSDVYGLYKYVPNWVGTPGTTLTTYAGLAKAPQRMDEGAVPLNDRSAILNPTDHWGLLGGQTGLYIQGPAEGAYREGSLGKIGGIDTFMAQNLPAHTTGSDVAGTVNQSIVAATTSYATVKNTMQQTITVASLNLNAGDVFTIAGVNDVNPVTKADLGRLKQFVCISYASNSLVMYPAMIWSGAFQNVAIATPSTTDLNGNAITGVGTAATAYRQNLVFNKNAFALAMVPLISPPGATSVSRQSYKGTSVRLIPTYDGTNDRSNFRLDCLYGVKAIDPRLAVRLSGT